VKVLNNSCPLVHKVNHVIKHRLGSEIIALHNHGIHVRDQQFQGKGYGSLDIMHVSSHFVFSKMNYSKLGKLYINIYIKSMDP
jgi:hypothetical protein